ncbi:MAG TPA: VOC family protein [Pseudonocardia sp.]
MPTNSTANGICWIDLGTPDVEASAAFYTALLGWDVARADPTGYRLAALHGHLVAAFGPADEPGPPYWTIYAATPDADATARAATTAGGTVVVPPAPAGDAGVAAVVRGPHGLPLSLWQPGAHLGTCLSGRHGTFAHAELRTDQPAAHADFLRAVVHWRLDGDLFRHDGEPVARVGPTTGPSTSAHWLVHFHVDHLDDAVQRALDLGAHAQPDGSLVDPAGALFALDPPQGPMSLDARTGQRRTGLRRGRTEAHTPPASTSAVSEPPAQLARMGKTRAVAESGSTV